MASQAASVSLIDTPQRYYMLQWLPKYRDLARPKYYDNPIRRWDAAVKNKKYTYNSADPLFFDHGQEHVNGGIQLVSPFPPH